MRDPAAKKGLVAFMGKTMQGQGSYLDKTNALRYVLARGLLALAVSAGLAMRDASCSVATVEIFEWG